MVWRYRPATAIVALLLAVAAPSIAAPQDDAQTLAELAREDLLVATVGYRLLTAGPPLCRERAGQLGLLVQDARQYPPALRPAAVRQFGLGRQPAVQAVVPGGPAARAGVQAGDAIVAAGGVAIDPAPASPVLDRRPASYAAVAALWQRLDAAAARGSVDIVVERNGAARTVRIAPVAGCALVVQLEPGTTRNAWSDGRGVAITSGMVAQTQSPDELAAVIGHELAHNILHHRDTLETAGIGRGLFSRIGRKGAQVRATEEEADRWGVYLAARAGYDPAAAAVFWRRYGAAFGDGLLPDATHPGWRARAAALDAAAAEVTARQRAGAPLVPDAR